MSPPSQTAEPAWIPEVEGMVAEIAAIADPAEQRRAAAAAPSLDRSTVQRIFDEVARQARVDAERSAELAALAAQLAELLDDDFGRGLAHKAAAFLLFLDSEYEKALARFQLAAELFAREGAELDRAATLSSSLHTLSYLGRYDEAYAAASEARAVFEAGGEQLRLARLDTNEGNILFRQERLADALERYRWALGRFEELDAAPQDIAAALHNVITCSIGLHDFEGSLAAYEKLRRYCEQHDMEPVAAQAEYNIAYLYFLRGEYDRALELYREARTLAERVGDRYHQALCDLDQAEIMLELNMGEEGSRLAGAALTAFEELGLGYEAGKAIAFLAIAASQEGRAVEALELFGRAKQRLRQEGNEAWVAILDLYQAVIYHDEKRSLEARKLALAALGFFEPSKLTGKTVLCELLLARIALQAGDLDEAHGRVRSALDRLRTLDAPALGFRAHLVAGEVAEASGDRDGAVSAHRASADLLENLRSHLKREELKLSFLRDKQEVYQNLVWLMMSGQPTAADKQEVFLQMERAKSRTLADLVSYRVDSLPVAAPGHSHLVEQMRKLRNELNWYYRQIDLEEVRSEDGGEGSRRAPPENATGNDAADRLADLHARSRRHEERLIATLGDLRAADAEFGSLQTASTLDLEAIRAMVPEGAMILEFFEARDTVFCCCLGRETLEVKPLTTMTLVREQQQRLSFQLAKFRLGSDYTERFADTLLSATRTHLRALHEELIAPLEPQLAAEHLIVIPHGSMHYLPFHAFLGDGGYLIDRFSLSYAPSANVYALCAAKLAAPGTSSLVLGVPTPGAPGIREEVEAIAEVLPDAALYLGEEATEARLRDQGAGARLIHIATHGFYRQDNPMFSAIQLGDSRLTLFDLYRLRLDAQMVVLSGCGTGLNVVEGGDELIGLSRGLLYAGARSAVMSLWDVADESTVSFMRGFYGSLLGGLAPARALREAMISIRESHPHPFFWAPFVLVGQFAAGGPESLAAGRPPQGGAVEPKGSTGTGGRDTPSPGLDHAAPVQPGSSHRCDDRRRGVVAKHRPAVGFAPLGL